MLFVIDRQFPARVWASELVGIEVSVGRTECAARLWVLGLGGCLEKERTKEREEDPVARTFI